MTYEEAKTALAAIGEEQLLSRFDTLSCDGQKALLRQIEETDFSCLPLFAARDRAAVRGAIAPIPAMQLPEIEAHAEEFREQGLSSLRSGACAAVLLAGGMGTRLGCSGPKGVVDIGLTHPVYIFQRLFESIAENAQAAGRPFHFFIMTSEKNDEETRGFLRKHRFFGYPEEYVHFFRQEMAPAVGEDGHVLLEAPGRIATSPNGNGGWFVSLLKAGFDRILQDEQISWLNVFSVDNVLQKICDPVFLGAVISSGCASGSKVIRKANRDERVGVMCLEDGKPSVIEYYEMSEELLDAKDAQGDPAYNFGVILNYLFRIPDLRKIADSSLPVHFAHKAVPCIDGEGKPIRPEEPNGWKLEYFILDMVKQLPGCLPFEVVREKEFAPIKAKEGADSIDTARALLVKNGYRL